MRCSNICVFVRQKCSPADKALSAPVFNLRIYWAAEKGQHCGFLCRRPSHRRSASPPAQALLASQRVAPVAPLAGAVPCPIREEGSAAFHFWFEVL